MSWRNAFLATLVAFVAYGCDRAVSDFARCSELEAKGDLAGASAACRAAITSDPESKSGKAAAAKLAVITKVQAAAEAKRKAEEQAERKRLLGPEDAPSWKPVSVAQISNWKVLVSRYPNTPEAKSAAWKLTEETSVCAHYAGLLPFTFADQLLDAENVLGGVAQAFSSLAEDDGVNEGSGWKLLAMASKAQNELLQPKQQELTAICDYIRRHELRAGEEAVKDSLLDSCKRVRTIFARMFKALDGTSGAGALADTYGAAWPSLSHQMESLTKIMIAAGDQRQATCKKLGPIPPVTAAAPQTTSASGDAPRTAPAAADQASIAACAKRERAACSQACDGGDMPSCLTLGKVLWDEKSVVLQQQCREPLTKACSANLAKACTALADCISRQPGDTKAEETALVTKACDLNDGNGCYMAGTHIKNGHGVTADPDRGRILLEKAFQLLPKACDAGDDDACYTLALEYQWGTSKMVETSAATAARFSRKACKLGNQSGCFAAKNWH